MKNAQPMADDLTHLQEVIVARFSGNVHFIHGIEIAGMPGGYAGGAPICLAARFQKAQRAYFGRKLPRNTE